ncbi:MAG: helix-turn-helix transcriptional regulator [Thermoleophilaceae bacterium]|nr:helix-turn-helix transcriptional regulator [Thermoleophilaceae bacterium]
MANKEIAQGLFVTVKTVEKHLASAYRKLGTSRAELLVALAPAGSPSDEAAPDAP